MQSERDMSQFLRNSRSPAPKRPQTPQKHGMIAALGFTARDVDALRHSVGCTSLKQMPLLNDTIAALKPNLPDLDFGKAPDRGLIKTGNGGKTAQVCKKEEEIRMAEAVAAIIRPKENMGAYDAQGHVGKIKVGMAWKI